MKKMIMLLSILLGLTLFVAACAGNGNPASSRGTPPGLATLPLPEPDGGPFGVDVSINMQTIDGFLNRPDVAYIDVRMLYDPADFEAIGGISRLTQTLPGFRVVPFPYIATLSPLPVGGAYEGDTLFDIVWGEDLQILEVTQNYAESEIILNELFPRDRVIFLMCGGAGYSNLARALLVHKGWDGNMIYHTGGNWHYEGDMALDMTISADNPGIATWRVNYAFIDFDRLTRIG